LSVSPSRSCLRASVLTGIVRKNIQCLLYSMRSRSPTSFDRLNSQRCDLIDREGIDDNKNDSGRRLSRSL
jgi:hypothetical protein